MSALIRTGPRCPKCDGFLAPDNVERGAEVCDPCMTTVRRRGKYLVLASGDVITLTGQVLRPPERLKCGCLFDDHGDWRPNGRGRNPRPYCPRHYNEKRRSDYAGRPLAVAAGIAA